MSEDLRPTAGQPSPRQGEAEPESERTGDVGEHASGSNNGGVGRISDRRIAVYVCQCGGNIGDYVDTDRVIEAVKDLPCVEMARQAMFTCSDTNQQEIIDDVEREDLDGFVVACCSPKLHMFTFRGVAERAGANPFQVTQVNLREQCSWTHTDDPEGATRKAIHLVTAGVERARLTEALQPIEVKTTPRVAVIGGGVAGMRAAIAISDVGLGVYLIERSPELGGQVRDMGALFPRGVVGHELVLRMRDEIARRPQIEVFTGSEVVDKSGTYGNYQVTIVGSDARREVTVGQIVVATGFESYEPAAGELGYGMPGVITLPQLRTLLDTTEGPILRDGRPVQTIAYIYCVGSRNDEHSYCSRYCCSATVHASLLVADRDPAVRQYHLYRDLRTYGRNELMFSESRKRGSYYLRFADDDPPVVSIDDAMIRVTTHDLLTAGAELTIEADLLVLVTGMVPRQNDELVGTLKLPVGRDGFFNEIHPKLRPVETVVDGTLIAGACQSPKTVAESVASGLAAAAQTAGVLKRGVASLDPQVAIVRADACDGCGECVAACPYAAIELHGSDEQRKATIVAASCKGCGACTPICPTNAIDLQGYTDAQVRAAIRGLLAGSAA
jgi:heterodisulfide reductase subunit A